MAPAAVPCRRKPGGIVGALRVPGDVARPSGGPDLRSNEAPEGCDHDDAPGSDDTPCGGNGAGLECGADRFGTDPDRQGGGGIIGFCHRTPTWTRMANVAKRM